MAVLMLKMAIILFVIAIGVVAGSFPFHEKTQKQPLKEGFCGWSTDGKCSLDLDCALGGCSGQVCQSKSEDPVVTTCEIRDCYRAEEYGLKCGCIEGRCNWSK